MRAGNQRVAREAIARLDGWLRPQFGRDSGEFQDRRADHLWCDRISNWIVSEIVACSDHLPTGDSTTSPQ